MATRIKNEARRRYSCTSRTATLFTNAGELAEEFGTHVAVVVFSPDGVPFAFGSPTADSVLRTYLPDASPPAPLHAPGVRSETAGEAAARMAGMRRELEEIKKALVAEGARVDASVEKIRAAQYSARKRNWWEVDVGALEEEELPVFVRALEKVRAEVQGRIDGMA